MTANIERNERDQAILKSAIEEIESLDELFEAGMITAAEAEDMGSPAWTSFTKIMGGNETTRNMMDRFERVWFSFYRKVVDARNAD